MTKRVPRERLDYPTLTPQRRQRIVTSVDIPSTEATFEPRSKSVHGESRHVEGNFVLTKADGGYRNGAGRPTGRPNVVTATLKRAVLLAAENVGEDGHGKDGLQGYLRRLALNEPQAFTSLLRRILPQQVHTSVDPQSALGQILEGARARLAIEKAKVINADPRSRKGW